VLRLFGRGGARRADLVAARLDADAALIEASDPDERDEVRSRLLLGWQTRLVDLLEEFPEARDEFMKWVEGVQGQLSTGQASWYQKNVASGQSTVFAVQSGNQEIHYMDSRAATDEES
jgi:hypothetical protein